MSSEDAPRLRYRRFAAKIAEAVEALVDDFTERKLVPAGDG